MLNNSPPDSKNRALFYSGMNPSSGLFGLKMDKPPRLPPPPKQCKKIKLDDLGMAPGVNKYPCNKSNEVSVSDLSSLVNCVDTLSGQSANSASPTDIYRLSMSMTPGNEKTSFLYDGYYISNLYMKVFVTEICDPGNTTILDQGQRQNMIYEYLLYLTKIKNFTKLNICPYFVNVLGGNLRVEFEDIEEFLHNIEMVDDISKATLTSSDKTDNLYRNMNMIINDNNNRPSISSRVYITPSPEIRSEILRNNVKYGYFITEGTPNTSTLSILLRNMFASGAISENLLYIIIFQILLACKTMYLAKIAHNDLHTGNVLVEQIVSNDCIVTDNYVFPLRSPVRVHIYDYDRGYFEDYKNPILNNIYISSSSQSNDLVEKRDIIKILSYLFVRSKQPSYFATSPSDFKFNIADVLIGDNIPVVEKYTRMMDFFTSRGNFLRAGDRGSNTDNDFKIFNRSVDDMIVMIYDLISTDNKPPPTFCTDYSTDYSTGIYYVMPQIFDTVGNIDTGKLDKLKLSFIAQYCSTRVA